jgi:hypothetical protein
MQGPGAEAPQVNLEFVATVPCRNRTMVQRLASSGGDKMCKFAKIRGFDVDER